MKTIKRVVVTCIVVLSVTLGLATALIFENESVCNQMRTIATDPVKIEYLENWATAKIEDQKFLELLGQIKTVYLSSIVTELGSQIDLDFQFLGFGDRATYVSFNRLVADRDDTFDSSKFNSIEVGVGRYAMIVNLNDPDELALERLIDQDTILEKVTEKSYIICGGR